MCAKDPTSRGALETCRDPARTTTSSRRCATSAMSGGSETLNALLTTGGNVTQAAEILKMSRSGLNYRLKQLGLR
jgi:transcriptional regulator of acetoin/glycerol metabolism